MSSDLAARIQDLLKSRFSLEDAQLSAAASLEDLGIDSLAAIEFMFDLEDAFGVSLSEERGDIKTVADIAALVQKALDARGSV